MYYIKSFLINFVAFWFQGKLIDLVVDDESDSSRFLYTLSSKHLIEVYDISRTGTCELQSELCKK